MRPVLMKNLITQVVFSSSGGRRCILSRFSGCKYMILLILAIVLLAEVVALSRSMPGAHAANPGVGKACSWYRVRRGDTLSQIAWHHRSNIWALAHVNQIANVNLIFTNQMLCIPFAVKHRRHRHASGLLPNGTVRWYAHNALEGSTRPQIVWLLNQAAARHGLPRRLLLAVAWQESGWNQHVIARDGGIGTMQIMPYTAMGLNRQTRARYDPYKLRDNIELGAIYLRSLWHGFGGNMVYVVSAYNQGGWNVRHRGIFNWRYVHSVLALMRQF
jgi:soluble lytic murein transglycosylase-like protein